MSGRAERLPAAFWAALTVAAGLRFYAVTYGLPAVFNADEPHLVNVAVSFGRGSLNPRFFKYPTVWMYTLFAAYALYFAGWSGLGLRRSAREFGSHFAWHPGPFYLIGRFLASVFSLLAIERVYRAARELFGGRAAAVAAWTLAVSTVAIESAHAAKPESMMLFVAAWAWWLAARYLADGRARDLAACGAAVGLAVSTQFIAAPLALLVPAIWIARRGETGAPIRDLALACAAGPVAFCLGSPFLVVHFREFLATLGDFQGMAEAGGGPIGLGIVLRNAATFADPWMLGGAMAALGAGAALRRRPTLGFALLLPLAGAVAMLARSPEGGWQRYLLAVFPALAILAGVGADRVWTSLTARSPLWTRHPAIGTALAAGLLAPGFLRSVAFDRELALPDTRTLSAAWIEKHVPAGSVILLDQEHASPRLPMNRPTVESMLARTRAAGHPRAKYYEYLLEGHPGGGYAIYRVLRDYRDLHSYPSYVALSAAGQPTLDVRAGMSALRAARVRYVVLSSSGADPARSPDLAAFFRELRRDGRLTAEFLPEKDKARGPEIRIYELAAGAERSRMRKE